MMTILILLAVIVIAYFLIKKKTQNTATTPAPTTTTAPVTTVMPTTTTAPTSAWYVLYRCDDSRNYYAALLTETPEYQTGERVEGATGVFYTVTGVTKSPGSPIITGITSTGQMGC